MVQPLPYKYKCQKCGYSKVVRPESDVLSVADFSSICPKCETTMKKVPLNMFDIIMSRIKF